VTDRRFTIHQFIVGHSSNNGTILSNLSLITIKCSIKERTATCYYFHRYTSLLHHQLICCLNLQENLSQFNPTQALPGSISTQICPSPTRLVHHENHRINRNLGNPCCFRYCLPGICCPVSSFIPITTYIYTWVVINASLVPFYLILFPLLISSSI